MKWTWLILFVVVGVVLIGCRANDEVTITPNTTIPTRTPITITRMVSDIETANGDEPLILRVWSNSRFSPEANPILTDKIAQFSAESGMEIDVRVKDADGLATGLNYVRIGRAIAPDLMPDLILLNDTDVAGALNEELLALVDARNVETADWYSIGRDLVVSEDEQTIIGWPIALVELHHVVWDQSSFTETFTTWDEWLETDVILGVRADDHSAVGLTLAHYTAAPDEPFEEAQMITALDQVGQVAQQVLVSSSLADSRVNGVLMAADQFMTLANENDTTLTPSALPNPSTAGLWLWGVTTDDPERQAAVIDLLRWLMNSENSGALTQSLQLVPANRSAFDFWETQPYTEFLRNYAEGARLRPSQFPLRNTLNLATLTMLSDPNADPAAVYQMITDVPLRR